MQRLARLVLVPFLIGALSIGAAWAGVAVAPAPEVAEELPPVASDQVAETAKNVKASKAGRDGDLPAAANGNAQEALARFAGKLPDGHVLAGAAKVNIAPQPDEAAGEVWATQGCATAGGDEEFRPHPEGLTRRAENLCRTRENRAVRVTSGPAPR